MCERGENRTDRGLCRLRLSHKAELQGVGQAFRSITWQQRTVFICNQALENKLTHVLLQTADLPWSGFARVVSSSRRFVVWRRATSRARCHFGQVRSQNYRSA